VETFVLSPSSTKILILKDFPLYEAHRIQFRAEFFNVLNRVVFAAPSANLNAPAIFGRISGQAKCGRGTFSWRLKYTF
jgi:hypothetical protein